MEKFFVTFVSELSGIGLGFTSDILYGTDSPVVFYDKVFQIVGDSISELLMIIARLS